MKQYANYHKHDHASNIFTPDTHVKCEDYLKRIKELGYNCYFTTNHGSGGDIFEAKTLCDQYEIKCFYGLEGYIVPNPLEKDKRNYHIIIIPKTNAARKKVNLITSHASEKGFYYKPRIFPEDLLALDPDDVYITTACVAGLMRDDDSVEMIFKPLVTHFGRNVMLEVQNHIDDAQKAINQKCLQFAEQYGLELIAANDSHYIYPEQGKERLEFLKGKGIDYGDEDTYILDYPDYDTMFARFQKQGILNDEQIERAIDNTRVFEQCEEIELNKDIKMPTVYPNLSPDEKIAELREHIDRKFAEIVKEENIQGEKLDMYLKGIQEEMQIIEDTKEINTADYFLLNEKIVDLAVNKYHGVLTRTGRGSAGGFYINRALGMTQIDRFTSPIKLYPERFISSARLLENRSMPDIDYNVASQTPFVQAAREILGEHSVYPMIAYGTMQMGEAFRNVCRSHGMAFDDFNEVAKHIESHTDDKKWKPYIDEAQSYVDVIVSASVHPCAHAIENKDLREEYGIVRVGDALCVMITSGEADFWKILKDDFLVVSVWGIIADTFEMIGRPILTVNQLLGDLDERIWKLYADGITCTLNQVDTDYATSLMRRYKAHSLSELAQFVAAVRPSFDAWRNDFIDRKPFTTGSPHLDKVLEETEGRITFQETLMTYFQWLGVTPAESIGLIKKISKKKIHPEDFAALEKRLREKWIENTGSEEHFDDTWNMVQGCMSYGFAAPHALATAIDSLYSAWLKVHYPLEYYTVVFGYYSDDIDKTNKLTEELDYFKIKLKSIKYGHSSGQYQISREENAIYKGVGSIKGLNAKSGDALYKLARTQHFDYFIDLLQAIRDGKILNMAQINILIKLDYFSDFGNMRTLLEIVRVYDLFKQGTAKSIPRDHLNGDNCMIYDGLVNGKTKSGTDAARLTILDMNAIFHRWEDYIKEKNYPDFTLKEKMANQIEYLGYCDLVTGKEEDRRKLLVTDVIPLKSKKSGEIWSYMTVAKSIGSGKESKWNVRPGSYEYQKYKKGDIIYCKKYSEKKAKNGDKYLWLDVYEILHE